jgi:triacylglycerol lipase
LREGTVEEQLATRTRNVISLCTPHFGTPLASFFTTMQGKNLLRLLTVLATSNQGRYAIFGAAQLTSLMAALDDNLGRRNTLLDMLSERLLNRVTLNRDDPLWQFLEEISSDQGAIIHLTPEGMDLFNAAVSDRPRVRYHSVVAAAHKPSIGRLLENLRPLERATTYSIFSILYSITSREHSHYPYPSPAAALDTELRRLLPFEVDAQTNDGVVPTRSQLYGELLDAVVADHLDVVGQFRRAGGRATSDWLASGSGFDETAFRGLWSAIAQAIAGR